MRKYPVTMHALEAGDEVFLTVCWWAQTTHYNCLYINMYYLYDINMKENTHRFVTEIF